MTPIAKESPVASLLFEFSSVAVDMRSRDLPVGVIKEWEGTPIGCGIKMPVKPPRDLWNLGRNGVKSKLSPPYRGLGCENRVVQVSVIAITGADRCCAPARARTPARTRARPLRLPNKAAKLPFPVCSTAIR